MKTNHPSRSRGGTILVLTAIMMVFMFAILAFAVDLGYLDVLRTEAQNAADASSLAGAWDLIDEGTLSGQGNPSLTLALAGATVRQYVASNPVAKGVPALAAEDLVVGYMADPTNPSSSLLVGEPYFSQGRYNAIQVSIRRNADQNGEVPLFFARVLGIQTSAISSTATAAFLNNFAGFETPSSGENSEILPFALDLQTWNALLAGVGSDNYSYNEDTGQVTPGQDDVLEADLYPLPNDITPPGNRGTVDIGGADNSTNDIKRQIVYGVSPSDFAALGKPLVLVNGQLTLNGDTGISAGVKTPLESIVGKPRVIPLFSTVVSPGNNATYTIVGFAGIRIMKVKLTGNPKYVYIQPAYVQMDGGVPGSGTPTSQFIYSRVALVR